MRTVLFCMLLVVFGYATHAQLTLQPRTGLRNSLTTIGYNDQPQFSPLDYVTSPEFALRLDYKFKKIHGPYTGISTSRSGIHYSFQDVNTGGQVFQAYKDDYRYEVSAGYEVTTKPIYFKKMPASGSSNTKGNHAYRLTRRQASNSTDSRVLHCGQLKKMCVQQKQVVAKLSETSPRCNDKYSQSTGSFSFQEPPETKEIYTRQASGWFVQIQPAAGLAFAPVVHS
jgi:hypothetical protein